METFTWKFKLWYFTHWLFMLIHTYLTQSDESEWRIVTCFMQNCLPPSFTPLKNAKMFLYSSLKMKRRNKYDMNSKGRSVSTLTISYNNSILTFYFVFSNDFWIFRFFLFNFKLLHIRMCLHFSLQKLDYFHLLPFLFLFFAREGEILINFCNLLNCNWKLKIIFTKCAHPLPSCHGI